MMIPKKVHITWKTKDILESDHPLVTHGIGRLHQMNPDWTFEVSDDADIDNYLKAFLPSADFNLIKDNKMPHKSDLWRLLKIYNEGGLYIDIDKLCNVSLNDIVEDGPMWVLPFCRDYDFSQDFMMSAPENPVIAGAIRLFLQRKREGINNDYFLGAQTYMHAITMAIVGRVVNTDPGVEVMDEIRSKLKTMPFVKIFREDPPYHTIVYNGDDVTDLESLKRDFYAKAGVKHWTGEW